ncbi:regulatory protein RecX [Patulibacter minatonensis]|uniref:regulatory protein RecX n=1 Tax=Patulibacter minatonensis TaxID=298163 RepID=UPI0012FBEB10|nr:regulatory protein RecX [Patulibacter minatonensis]
MTSDHHDPGGRGTDEPLEDLFAEVDGADLSVDDAALPDLTRDTGDRTPAAVDDPDAPGDASALPDLATGRQGSLEDLGGDWEAPVPPPVADTGDDWAPVVPAAAASRGDRLADRAERRTPRSSRADAGAAGAVALAVAAAAAAANRIDPGATAGTGPSADGAAPRPEDATSDAHGRPAGGGPDDLAGAPPLEPSSLFSSEDPADGKPKRLLTAEERLQHAITLAYRHLSKRDRTIAEVRGHLEKKSIDATSVQGAIAELVEVGYLDDARYAERFVEDKRRLEGWGSLRIEQGLRKTGIDAALIDAALADDPLKDDEDVLAVEALEQRLRGAAPDGDRGRQKALRMLATKGYALETAYAAVRTYERRCAERAEP